LLIIQLQRLVPAGVVDWLLNILLSRFLDFKISHNAALAEVDLFLRYDLKDLSPFLMKRFLFFKDIKVKKSRNKSTTPAGE